jgi:hypothetical protein
MKKTLLTLIGMLVALIGFAQWTNMNAPDSINYTHLRVHPDGQKIACNAHVYNSTTFQYTPYIVSSANGGATWSVFPGQNMMDSFWYQDYYYIRTFSGLYRSSNLGESFELVIASVPGWGEMAIAPNGNLIVFNDQFDYPNYSTDGGFTWTSGTGLTPNGMYSFALANNGNIVAGLTDGVVYSTDNGVTWSMSQYNGGAAWPNVQRNSISKTSDGTLFCMEGNYFDVSIDNGLTWTSVTASPIMSTFVDSESAGNSVLAAGIFEIYTSVDQANNFTSELVFNSNYDFEKGVGGDIWNARQFGIFKKNFGGVGVAEFENTSMKVYPNPCTEQVTISLEGHNSDFQVDIYSIDGRLVKSIANQSFTNTLVIDTTELESGNYLIILSNDQGIMTCNQLLVTNN